MKPKVIAMVGLPRSGKSTIVAELAKRLGAPIVRKDAIRLALHGKRYETLAEPMIRAVSGIMLRSLILSGHEVVIVDETHFSRASRDFLKSPDWDVYFYEVTTSPEVCKKRAIANEQSDLIPIIEAMSLRYEPLGDDELIYET